jgi:hypothetical protein
MEQRSVTLSTAEAELAAAAACAQDLSHAMRVLESVGSKVKKPMILEIDNKGAVNFTNNWSVRGRTRHVEVRQCFLRELKEQNIIHTVRISEDEMSSDLFAKNLDRPLFERDAKVHCGNHEHMKVIESRKQSLCE